jgi:Bacterial surface proteins containing Ig-like domains
MKHRAKIKHNYLAIFISMIMILSSLLMNVQPIKAETTAPTIVSAVTDHIGKKITLTFDRPMKDPSGTQDQFTVEGLSITQLPSIGGKPKNDYKIGSVPVTSVTLGSDPKQIILSISKLVSSNSSVNITVSYTKGSVAAADGMMVESFTDQGVTDNNVSNMQIVAFDSEATEIGYDTDTSDQLNPTLKFKYDNPIDYDNVQLVWYFYNGFPGTKMDDNVKNYVEFYEKDSGKAVVLPNVLTYDGSATYKDGTQQPQRILTDWYFWQIQHYVPLGLNLVSQAIKPSTTYVIKIKKGFQFNNGGAITNTYSFEFTTTAESSTKPYWETGSSVTASNVTENSLTLGWSAAQDNHGVTGYNIYKNDALLTTVDGSTTSYDVSNLLSGTEYKFKVEAVDFADNRSIIEVPQATLGTPPAVSVATTIDLSGLASVSIPASSTTASYTATVKDQNSNTMNGENVTWSLQTPVTGVRIDSAAGIVTIDNSASVGSFTVVASDGSVTGRETVSITLSDVQLSDAEAVAAYETLANGDLSTQDKVDAANAAKALVHLDGLNDTDKAALQTRIATADAKVVAAQKAIDVAKVVAATGIQLDKNTLTVQISKTATIKATLQPTNSTDGITFTSSDPKIATVDAATGVVTGKEEGNVTITAKAGNVTATCTVNVTIDECFIATAAYGSKFQPSVKLLRHFRDDYLLTNTIGSAFVKFYYKNSPPIADFIAHNEVLKTTVRALLTPFVAAVYGLYHPIVACMALVLMCMLVLVKRKYKFQHKL